MLYESDINQCIILINVPRYVQCLIGSCVPLCRVEKANRDRTLYMLLLYKIKYTDGEMGYNRFFMK